MIDGIRLPSRSLFRCTGLEFLRFQGLGGGRGDKLALFLSHLPEISRDLLGPSPPRLLILLIIEADPDLNLARLELNFHPLNASQRHFVHTVGPLSGEEGDEHLRHIMRIGLAEGVVV